MEITLKGKTTTINNEEITFIEEFYKHTKKVNDARNGLEKKATNPLGVIEQMKLLLTCELNMIISLTSEDFVKSLELSAANIKEISTTFLSFTQQISNGMKETIEEMLEVSNSAKETFAELKENA